MDIIIVDNSQLKESGLLPNQLAYMQNLGELINSMRDRRETLFVFFECNGTKPIIGTDLRELSKLINNLQLNTYDAPASYKSDREQLFEKVLKIRQEFTITDQLNVYYFMPPRYFDANNFINRFELARYINVLPRELASLGGESNPIINVQICLPQYLQTFENPEDLQQRIKNISSFKNDQDPYEKINFTAIIAN